MPCSRKVAGNDRAWSTQDFTSSYESIPLQNTTHSFCFIAPSGYAKLNIAVAKGKKLHDKRETLKKKDIARDLERG